MIKTWEYGTSNDENNNRKGRLTQAERYNYPPVGNPVAIIEKYKHENGTAGPSETQRQQWNINSPGNAQWGPTFEITVTYDKLGNPTSLGYPKCIANTTGQGGAKVCDDAGDVPAPDAPATWTYNEGLMRTAAFSLGPNATYDYHHNLQVAEAMFGNSVIGAMGRGTNGMVRPFRYQVGLDVNTIHWDSGAYAYDEAGNIKSIGDDLYTYDAANRLRSATVMQAGAGRTESYVYNTTDSMTQVTNDQFGIRPFNVDTTTNRLLGLGATVNNWTYDGAGNTLTAAGGDFSYVWDATNMLSRYREGSKDFVSIYGPGDYRVWIEDRSTNTKYWALRGADGKILREYEVTPNGAGGNWTHQRDFLYGAEGIVASVDHDGTQLYYHSDHLGTARLKTTAAGLPFSEHHYYAYGLDANFSQVFEDGFETGDELGWEKDKDVLSIKYTGHERERFKNLDYMLGRHYSHVANRFMSVDPARDGWNLYSYAAGNPTRYIDPNGLDVTFPRSMKVAIEKGLSRSPEFKRIYTRLDSDSSVQVDLGVKFQAKPGTQADTSLTKVTDQQGNLVGVEANVDLPGFSARKPEVIGHELKHVEEVLDTGKLQNERLNDPDVWQNSQGFETKQAQETEKLIDNELHANRKVPVQNVTVVCQGQTCEIQ